MKSLTLRIYLSVVAVLALFGVVSGWLVDRALTEQRARTEAAVHERWAAWGDLLQHALPPADAPQEEQIQAIQEWSRRLRMPLALDDAKGQRVFTTQAFARRQGRSGQMIEFAIALDDGRTLRAIRPAASAAPRLGAGAAWRPGAEGHARERPSGLGMAILLVLLFAAVAGAAWPVARALTRRLQTLQSGVQAFGSGQLGYRVPVEGKDEVAAVANSFNQAAERIQALVESHRSLLANASHELRSPLARLKMALAMLDSAQGERRAGLQREIERNIAELDALVEEVLLASRLDAQTEAAPARRLDLLALAAEEASALRVPLHGQIAWVMGDERLLRRALRNLLENALRYGTGEPGDSAPTSARPKMDSLGEHGMPAPGVGEREAAEGGAAAGEPPGAEALTPGDRGLVVELSPRAQRVQLRVCDRGPGVPDAQKARIFEPFFRLPGHAEQAGGVGLGLSLVRQIAQRHGGRVWCEDRPGGGTCFVLELPSV